MNTLEISEAKILRGDIIEKLYAAILMSTP